MKAIHIFLFLAVLLFQGCDGCCDDEIPFYRIEDKRSFIPYSTGDILFFLKNGTDTLSYEVEPTRLDTFVDKPFAHCPISKSEWLEIRIKGIGHENNFRIEFYSNVDSLLSINMPKALYSNILVDSTLVPLCRGSHPSIKQTCLDSFTVLGKTFYNVISYSNIDYNSPDTLFYSPEYGILAVRLYGNEKFERLW